MRTAHPSVRTVTPDAGFASLRTGLYLACLVTAGFWPGNPLLDFGFSMGTPLLFPALFMFLLVYTGHHLLALGRGEFESAPQSPAGLFIHCLAVQALFCPFYLVSAVLGGISPSLCGLSICTILTASLVSAAAGYLCRRVLGRSSPFGFFASRIMFLLFLTATGWMTPVSNPVYVLYRIFRSQGPDPEILHLALQHNRLLLAIALVLIPAGIVLGNRKKAGQP